MSGVLTGIIPAVLIAGYFYFHKDTGEPLKEITVTQVSGEKIAHSGFNYTAGNIKFTTIADGKGEIFTEIPKTDIPEAKAWMENTNSVMLELLLQDKRIYGASYMKRWGNFSAGGGVLVSVNSFEGVKIQVQYWFSI
jgi:hypothetical protein